MPFRLPNTGIHILEAATQAVQAAAKGQKDATRLVQVFDENNRAIEDAMQSVQGSVVIDTAEITPVAAGGGATGIATYTWTPNTGQTILSATAHMSGNVASDGKLWVLMEQTGFSGGLAGPGEPSPVTGFSSNSAGVGITLPVTGNGTVGLAFAYDTTDTNPVTFDIYLTASVARS